MPLLMVVAEWRWLRTRDEVYLDARQALGQGDRHPLRGRRGLGDRALLRAGAALAAVHGLRRARSSGCRSRSKASPSSPRRSSSASTSTAGSACAAGAPRGGRAGRLCGAASGIFVVIANAWMNSAGGFGSSTAGRRHRPRGGDAQPAAFPQALHMTLAAYAATGFAVAGIHACLLLRDRDNLFHRRALGIALAVGGAAALLQPLSGRHARPGGGTAPAREARRAWRGSSRPSGARRCASGASRTRDRRDALRIEIPYALSLLAFHDPDARSKGWRRSRATSGRRSRSSTSAFQIMVGRVERWWRSRLGGWCAGLAAAGALSECALVPARGRRWRRPLGFVAIEAGWTVTEVGRQPWIIYRA